MREQYGPYRCFKKRADMFKVGDVYVASLYGYAWEIIGIEDIGDRVTWALKWTGKGGDPGVSHTIYETQRKEREVYYGTDGPPKCFPCFDSDCECIWESF